MPTWLPPVKTLEDNETLGRITRQSIIVYTVCLPKLLSGTIDYASINFPLKKNKNNAKFSLLGRPIHSFMFISRFYLWPPKLKDSLRQGVVRVTWPDWPGYAVSLLQIGVPDVLRVWQPSFVQSRWFYVLWSRSGADSSCTFLKQNRHWKKLRDYSSTTTTTTLTQKSSINTFSSNNKQI